MSHSEQLAIVGTHIEMMRGKQLDGSRNGPRSQFVDRSCVLFPDVLGYIHSFITSYHKNESYIHDL